MSYNQASGQKISDRLREQALDTTLLTEVLSYSVDYMGTALDRPVFPTPDAVEGLHAFDEPLPQEPGDVHALLALLHSKGSPATVAQTGGRYFGFVNGGIAPAGLAAKWLADVWDQNTAMYVISPIASRLEEICEQWLTSLLGLPAGTAAGFVGGSSTATLCGLAAGRNHLLQGLGSERVFKVPMDAQGRIRPELVPELDNRTLLILQAGNVNSGAFDPFDALCEKARTAGAWVHVDGAFGLWAAASEPLKHLAAGVEKADSWSVDAHKTLNAPYDNGIVLCRNRDALTGALHMTGSYIIYSPQRDGMLYTPEMSRRARIVELWATLKSMGRRGVSELVEDLHRKAEYFAQGLAQAGFSIRNEVCFNQVLVAGETPELTAAVLKAVQDSGELWCGGAQWEGQPVIRLSVCSYRTTEEDIDRCIRAFVTARAQIEASNAF